jgi:hypothetical protein
MCRLIEGRTGRASLQAFAFVLLREREVSESSEVSELSDLAKNGAKRGQDAGNGHAMARPYFAECAII